MYTSWGASGGVLLKPTMVDNVKAFNLNKLLNSKISKSDRYPHKSKKYKTLQQ